MAFKTGDAVRIKDIRNNYDYPLQMRLLSGQCGHVMGIIRAETVCSGKDRTAQNYYELDTDAGYGLWPEDFLEPYETPKSEPEDQEWIDTVLKLIAEIEGKLDQLKRQLWRKKHYGNGNR
jgi:hypothetical protein